MSTEAPTALQYNLFSGELVDNRTAAQKKRDRERALPQQPLLFPARAIAQFGVNPRPLIDLSPHTRLTLWQEDPRTDEERERDRRQAAEALTYSLFEEDPPSESPAEVGEKTSPQAVAEYIVWAAVEDMLLLAHL